MKARRPPFMVNIFATALMTNGRAPVLSESIELWQDEQDFYCNDGFETRCLGPRVGKDVAVIPRTMKC